MLRHKIVKWVLGVLIACVVLEVMLRTAGVKPKIRFLDTAGPFQRHPALGWTFKANYSGKWTGIPFTTNSAGLRDTEIQNPKQSDVFRILLLGGSVSAGNAVTLEHIFPQRVERFFQAQSIPVEVVNAGVPGYSTKQELQVLEIRSPEVHPDLLILDFAVNDVLDGRTTPKNQTDRPEFIAAGAYLDLGPPVEGVDQYLQSVVHRWPRHTAIFSAALWIKSRTLKFLNPGEETNMFRWAEAEILKPQPSALVEAGWRDTKADLLAMKEATENLKIPFVIMMFPLAVQLQSTAGNDVPQKIMEEFCSKNQIVLVDLLPAFRQKVKEDPSFRLFVDADHPTVGGHELAALALQATLPPLIRK